MKSRERSTPADLASCIRLLLAFVAEAQSDMHAESVVRCTVETLSRYRSFAHESLQEQRKQAAIVKVRTQPKHAARYVWIIRDSERHDYKDLKGAPLKNVGGMKNFVRHTINSLDHDATLTGMGGR